MIKSFKVNNIKIGEGQKTFIIAEIGINHQGSFEKCKKLIKAAHLSGANAAKIQLINENESYNHKTKSFKEFKNKSFSLTQLKKLKRYSDKIGIIFFATPGDIFSLKKIIKCKIKIIKISSGLSNNFPLIREAIKYRIPLFISTGMSDNKDLKELKYFLKKYKYKKIVIMKCVSLYPTKSKLLNLKTILKLKKFFDYNIGYSDHSLGELGPISSVPLGACVLEKHFTLNKNIVGADHKISMEPKEFKSMVEKIREIEEILGKSNNTINKKVLITRNKNLRYLTSKNEILKNERFSLNNISFKRYNNLNKGLSPKFFFKIEGKKAKINIKKDSPIKLSDIF